MARIVNLINVKRLNIRKPQNKIPMDFNSRSLKESLFTIIKKTN